MITFSDQRVTRDTRDVLSRMTIPCVNSFWRVLDAIGVIQGHMQAYAGIHVHAILNNIRRSRARDLHHQ